MVVCVVLLVMLFGLRFGLCSYLFSFSSIYNLFSWGVLVFVWGVCFEIVCISVCGNVLQ